MNIIFMVNFPWVLDVDTIKDLCFEVYRNFATGLPNSHRPVQLSSNSLKSESSEVNIIDQQHHFMNHKWWFKELSCHENEEFDFVIAYNTEWSH